MRFCRWVKTAFVVSNLSWVGVEVGRDDAVSGANEIREEDLCRYGDMRAMSIGVGRCERK